MKAGKVKIYPGIGSLTVELKGRKMSYTGAWNLIVEDDKKRTFSIECLVPGSPGSLSGVAGVTGDWSSNDYAIELSAYNEKGEHFQVDQEDANNLMGVLMQIESGELKPINLYGDEVSTDYVERVIDFIKPRLEYVPQNLEHGFIATKRDIETSMRRNEIPSLSRA